MATTYNRFNINILCIADSADATDLQSKVLRRSAPFRSSLSR